MCYEIEFSKLMKCNIYTNAIMTEVPFMLIVVHWKQKLRKRKVKGKGTSCITL